jgi:hypothetical protein
MSNADTVKLEACRRERIIINSLVTYLFSQKSEKLQGVRA